MIEIRPYAADMEEEVLDLLLGSFSPNSPAIKKEHWVALLRYQSKSDLDCPLGLVLMADGHAVGFLGLIVSERNIAGKKENICSLSSWIVLPEFRQHSVQLLSAMVKIKGCAIASITPTELSQRILKKFGFRELESNYWLVSPRIILPFPGIGGMLGALVFSFHTDASRIESILSGEELEIFRDHKEFHCRHLLIVSGSESCLVIFTTTSGYRFNFAVLQHVSNVSFFRENLQAIRLGFIRRFGLARMMMDSRLIGREEGPGLQKVPGPVRLLKSDHLEPEQIDNLYSELVMLPDLF